jgi:hypothetical protein
MKRGPVHGGDESAQGFLLSVSCCIPPPSSLVCVNKLKEVVSSKFYHMVGNTNIHMNKQVEKNIGRYAGEKA